MDFPTSTPVYYQDDAPSSPGGGVGDMRPTAVFDRSYSGKSLSTTEHSPVSETFEARHDEIHDFAETTTRSPDPSNISRDMRPPFTCNKSWKPKVVLDQNKYKGFGYGEVVLKKTNNGLKVSNGFQLESAPVQRRKWDYGHS
jgi:hypothetical protein